MIIGYILLGFGAVLIVILALIYQKLNKKSENTDLKDDFNLERERKKDFGDFKDKILKAINASSTELKQDFVAIKERVSNVQSAQQQLDKLANEVIDFKWLINKYHNELYRQFEFFNINISEMDTATTN